MIVINLYILLLFSYPITLLIFLIIIVNCPLEDPKNDTSSGGILNVLSNLSLGLKNSLVSTTLGAKSHCIGSLTIEHEDDEGSFGRIPLRGNRDQYPNLKRGFQILKRNSVSILTVLGNCCWEIYENPKFRGQKEIITPEGGDFSPSFQPISIQRTECIE